MDLIKSIFTFKRRGGEMKRFLIFLCAVMLVFGMVGSASAIPILNNGIDLDDAGNLYGTYINSGSLLFTQRGNNDGNKLEGVEMLVENELGYNADDFDLTVTSMSYSSDDGGFTGLWNANPEDTLISFYAVKAGRGYAMYQVYPAEGTGSWSTYDLWVTGLYNNGADLEISHYTGYNSVPAPAPVPEPTTILLMGTGLLGLVGYSRKRSGKKSVTRF
jgi:hypothetical protein